MIDLLSWLSGFVTAITSLILFFSLYHFLSHGLKRPMPLDLFGYWAHGEWRHDWQDTFRVKETKRE